MPFHFSHTKKNVMSQVEENVGTDDASGVFVNTSHFQTLVKTHDLIIRIRADI